MLIAAISILSISSFAAVIQVSAPNDLQNFANTMNDGDIIELTTSGGSYFWSSQLTISTEKAITIRAKSSLTVRPKVVFTASTGGFLRYNASLATPTTKSWTFDGIEFDGYNTSAGYYAANFIVSNITAPYYGINYKINNCVLKNFSSRTIYYQGSGGTTASTVAQGGDIDVTNTEFRNIGSGAFYSNNILMYNPNNLKFTNCLFLGPGANTIFIELNATNYNSYLIDHCTFVNSNRRELYLATPKSTSYIRNCLFVNNINLNSNNLYNVTLGSNCGIYYTGTGNKNNLYPFSTAVRTTNPALNATTGIATATSYLTGTTDGLPTGFYGNQIICSESSISELSYTGGSGPSAAKSFVVSATRLTNNLTITAPTNFEISTSSTTGFTSTPIILNHSSGNIASTTIYTRLKAGLVDNIYSGTLNLSSAGAATIQISLSGTVVSKPTIFTSLSSISGFSYMAGNGPSGQTMFTLNGAGLTGSVTISAPTNFEISLNSGTSFSGSNSLTISQIAGKVNNLNVFVRLKAGLMSNLYAGNISLTSSGADTKTIALSGTVTPAPVVLNISKTSLTNFSYSFGSGPSALQSFNVSGSGLTSNILLTAPLGYELSTFSGTSFSGSPTLTLTQSNGSISLINIYVRLKKDLAVGTYADNITVQTSGTTTKQINLSGYVTEATGITLTTTRLSGFEYIYNSGPSAEKSFDMTGVNLNSYVVVSAPTNYVVSTSNGVDFSGSGQILIDQASVSGQTLRIYVRLNSGLAAGAYNGNVTVSSSGATTKTIALTGNVYNQLTVATDPAFYEPRFGGNYTFSNKWILSKNTNNYTAGNELIAASGMARDMAVRNGKMLFIDRGNKQIVVVNGETGLKEAPVVLNPSLFTYVGRNVANTADSIYTAGTLTYNNIKVDASGNVLVGNLITANTQRFQIYKIDMATGNGTLVIDQANLANLFPLALTLRFDYFGVWGDINTNAVILAPNASASAMEVYKWVISGGIVGAPTVIRLDNTTLGTYFSGLESLGGNPHIFPVAADKFYVDGGGTYPTLVNNNGNVIDGFHRQPTALKDSVTVAGLSFVMNPGNNGVSEFSVGGNHFMVTSATNTTGIPASTFRLFKFKDATKSFADIDCMWTFPQAGMGIASNAYRTALPVVVTNGYSAKIYVYCGENGFGMYEMNMNPLSTDIDKNKIKNYQIKYKKGELRVAQTVKRLEVYTLSGQLLNAVSNNLALNVPTTQGVYIAKIITFEGAIITQKVIFN
jgi:hypothetical protein